MARPGYNNDDSLNTYTPPSRNTWGGGGGGGRDQGNQDQQSRDQTANELDQMMGNQGNQQSRDQTANELDQMMNKYGGYSNANEQLAASLKAAGALTSGALSGQALWNRLPVGMAEEIIRKGGDPTLYANEVFSSFSEGTQAYSPTGILSITGPGALYENGQLVEGHPANYKVVNPYSSGFNSGSGGGGGGYNYGSGSGYGNGSGYISKPEINSYNPDFAQWGRSSVQGDFIRNQKANRGGIISLMR
jgi:hypothetical protein